MPSDEAMELAKKIEYDGYFNLGKFGHQPEDIVALAQIIDDVMQPQWTRVEDELPEENKRVIVWGGIHVAEAWHFRGEWEYVCGIIKVTHWMPLPEPPKEDK